jgi:hypothetical protein
MTGNIQLKKIEVNQLNNLDGFATRNYVINVLKTELNKNREVENKNNVVGNWVLGYEGDLRNSIDLLNVFPIGLAWWTEGNKRTCLENGNLFLEVIYACKKIEEFNEAWKANNLLKIQEVFIVLQEIRQGRGRVSEKALDFERWGARGTGETLRKRLDDALKIYVLKSNEQQTKKELELNRAGHLEKQLQELSQILFPNQSYDFNQLKQEIIRFKHQELAPRIRNKRTELEQLIASAKSKAGDSERMVELLLEIHQKKEQVAEISQKDKLNGKIEAYQSILEGVLTSEELQNLLTKQTELFHLEKHLSILQSEQQAQIIQSPVKN